MATYPPPSEILPVFNPNSYLNLSSGLTISEGDMRYAQLSGSIIRGLTTFQAGLSTASITNSGNTFTVPSSSGQLALVSQIPSASSFVTLSGSQSITGTKTFSNSALQMTNSSFNSTFTLPTLTANRTYTLRDADGTIAFLSDITASVFSPSNPYTWTATQTYSVPPSMNSITDSGNTFTVPSSSGQLALVSQIPTNANYVDLSTNQSIFGAKTFNNIFASNLIGCVFFSNPIGGGGSLSFDTTSASTFSGVFRLPSLAANATYTLPTTSGFLLETIGNYSTVASQGLTLSDAQTISNAAYLAGATLNAAATTYTDSATAASGTVGQVSDFLIGARTFAATNTAVTYTNAASLRITGAPIAGTNVTMTNRNAILIDSGNIRMTALGTTASPALAIGTLANDGIYSSGAANINIALNGALRYTFGSTTLTGASGVGITLSGSALITSGTGGFGSAGPLSSSLASSVTACAVRPTNTANTGIFGSGATNVSVAVGGTQILSCATTGITVTGTTQSSTSILTPIVRSIAGNGTTLCPATDAAAGTCTVTITPSSAGWTTAGTATLNFGDTNHGVSTIFGTGLTLFSSNGVRFGTTGSYFVSMQRGSFTYSTSLAAGGFVTQSVGFGNTFASTPSQVIVSLNLASGASFWDQCLVTATSITTTGFVAAIKNTAGSATTGSVLICFIAIQ